MITHTVHFLVLWLWWHQLDSAHLLLRRNSTSHHLTLLRLQQLLSCELSIQRLDHLLLLAYHRGLSLYLGKSLLLVLIRKPSHTPNLVLQTRNAPKYSLFDQGQACSER